MKFDLKPVKTIHDIFPTQIMEFEDIEIPQCVWDALHNEELGLYNFPNTVYTSRGDLHKRPEFALITKQVQDCLDTYMVQHMLSCNRLEISLMWSVFAKAREGGHHPIHRHTMSAVCGILYLTDGVSTVFHDPVTSRSYDCLEVERNDGWHPYWSNPAKKGTILLWPGWLLHSSQPNNTENDRWGISFNSLPTGDVNNTANDYPQARISIS